MDIRNKLILEYPLTKRVESELDCYLLAKRRYLVFWENIIDKDNINQILNIIEGKTNNNRFSKWKTIIVFGYTESEFERSHLFYFNNLNTLVVFYLINKKENKFYMNDDWIFLIGCNYKKYVRRINKILLNKE